MRPIFGAIFLVSLVMIFAVIELSRRDILDKNSFFISFSLSLGLSFFSLMPDILRGLSSFLGFSYTYVFSSTAGIIVLLALNIYTLSKLNRTERRLSDLTQEIALQED